MGTGGGVDNFYVGDLVVNNSVIMRMGNAKAVYAFIKGGVL